jgi:hypothetical protein
MFLRFICLDKMTVVTDCRVYLLKSKIFAISFKISSNARILVINLALCTVKLCSNKDHSRARSLASEIDRCEDSAPLKSRHGLLWCPGFSISAHVDATSSFIECDLSAHEHEARHGLHVIRSFCLTLVVSVICVSAKGSRME